MGGGVPCGGVLMDSVHTSCETCVWPMPYSKTVIGKLLFFGTRWSLKMVADAKMPYWMNILCLFGVTRVLFTWFYLAFSLN